MITRLRHFLFFRSAPRTYPLNDVKRVYALVQRDEENRNSVLFRRLMVQVGKQKKLVLLAKAKSYPMNEMVEKLGTILREEDPVVRTTLAQAIPGILLSHYKKFRVRVIRFTIAIAIAVVLGVLLGVLLI